MKKIIYTVVTTVVMLATSVSAQDLITKKNGEDVKAKVLEISQTEIKYKQFDNLAGPTYSIPISDVLMIRYKNGTSDVFNKTEAKSAVENQPLNTKKDLPLGVRINMKYSEYAKLYKTNSYSPQPGDPYDPTVCGLASLFIPGLGQMLADEPGKGLLYLVGVGCFYWIGATSDNTFGYVFFLGLGLLGHIGIILDAVDMAKIKNMYLRDTRNLSAINFKVCPYTETLSMGNKQITSVGLSLRASF